MASVEDKLRQDGFVLFSIHISAERDKLRPRMTLIELSSSQRLRCMERRVVCCLSLCWRLCLHNNNNTGALLRRRSLYLWVGSRSSFYCYVVRSLPLSLLWFFFEILVAI